MEIDEQTRIKHAKLHSAGHLIDLGVQRLSTSLFMQNFSGRLPRGIILRMDLTFSTGGSCRMGRRQGRVSTDRLRGS